jgi:drug/metabolite transporter (DMT)-like permease
MYTHQNKGITAGIAAGIFWATPFLVPMILTDFDAFEIVFGRFLFFGAISALYLPRIIRLLKGLNKRDLLQLFFLSAAGYWLYTFFLFIGIKLTNGMIAALIIGCMPLTLTLFSKPYYNLRLAAGLVFILTGMGFLFVPPLYYKASTGAIDLFGIVYLFIALGLWTWFGIFNAHFMHRNHHIKASDYSSTMGLMSLIIIAPIFMLLHGFSFLHHPRLVSYLGWSAVLGIGASWLANALWVYCSKHCPRSIIGALLISETLFALIYSFIFAWRLPYAHELLAMCSLMLGVFLVIVSQQKPMLD